MRKTYIQDAEHLAEELQRSLEEIKDTKRETGRKMLGEQLRSF